MNKESTPESLSGNSLLDHAAMMVRYKAWASALAFGTLSALPLLEITRRRETHFGSIASTLRHIYVVDDIFRAHLQGRPHGYRTRNTEEIPDLDEQQHNSEEMGAWYIEYTASLDSQALHELVSFEFVGGGAGSMTRLEILLHIVNHGTYHHGFVSDMMYQIPAQPPANDLPVFLRDCWRSIPK